MNKLETLTELLVNELSDFESNVKKLENSLQKAENLKIKLDMSPVEKLVFELVNFQHREIENREAYITRLSRKIENAKIYPKWAVITFMSMIATTLLVSFYAYIVKTDATSNEREAYINGEKAATEHIKFFLRENPKALVRYKKWLETRE